MADEPNPDIDETEDELLLDEPLDADAPPIEGEDELEPDEEEETPSFGDEAEPQQSDNGLVKHLREQIRERDRRLAEASRTATKREPVNPGPEPTLEDCDFDPDLFKTRLREWDKAVEAANAEKSETDAAAEDQAKLWETRLSRIAQEKTALGKADTDEMFETVKTALSDTQLASVIAVVDEGNSAKFVYALGKHPERLAALASQSDPIRFIKEVTRLEGQLKMVKRTAPALDAPERGSARISRQTADKKLAKLEADAEKTGDRTALIAYKRNLKKAATT